MTVRELIEKLNRFDQGLRVVTGGFDELGLEDVGEPESVPVKFRDDRPFGLGCHDEGTIDDNDWYAVLIDR